METLKKTSLQEALLICVFLLYFCADAVYSLLFRFVGSDYIGIVYNVAFAIFVFSYLIITSFKNLAPAVFCCTCVLLLVMTTIAVFPENSSWLLYNESYSVQVQFLNLRGAIWAVLVISLAYDREKLCRYFQIVCNFLWVYLTLKYLVANARGFWKEIDSTGQIFESNYSLSFGYQMLFPVLFFLGSAFLQRKRLCFIPAIIGFVEVLFGGSRGPLVCIVLFFVMLIVFACRDATVRKRVAIIAALVLVFASVLYFSGCVDAVVQWGAEAIAGSGISSRTIDALANGSISDDSGRDEIWGIAFNLIENGGAFGHGVYGDRLVIGLEFVWGYSHNFLLEWYVSFGYLGGTMLTVLFVLGLVLLVKNCKNNDECLLVAVFIGCSGKLWLSDSFWYLPQFWCLLTLIVLWGYKRSILAAVSRSKEYRIKSASSSVAG